MTSSLLLGAVLAWGTPFLATPQNDDAYLCVIEKLAGDAVWVRATFKRNGDGDWTPTLVLEKVRGPDGLSAAPAALPARITWRICRDGRSLDFAASSCAA